MQKEKISENFNRSEFACRGRKCCNHSSSIDRDLVLALEKLRSYIRYNIKSNFKIKITSGFRCLVHNKNVGSNDNSQHTIGLAADIQDSSQNPLSTLKIAKAARHIKAFKGGGIGIYDTFVHLDVRKKKARWNKRTK